MYRLPTYNLRQVFTRHYNGQLLKYNINNKTKI